MVHALEQIHQLLAPDGRLVDIHPLENARPIEVRLAGEILLAGWLRETDDYIEYVQATEAIEQVVEQGWFICERQDQFTFTYHAEHIYELRDYLKDNAQRAILDELVIMRAEDLMRTIEPDKEILMQVPVSITRLRPVMLPR